MDLHFLTVIGVGIVASLCLNIGKAVQKMKVQVLKTGWAMFGPVHRRDFLIWSLGITGTITASLLLLVAQNMADKPSVVTSLGGVGLIGLAIFASLVLKERVGPREWGAIACIIAGTAIVQYFNVDSGHDKHFEIEALMWVCAILGGGFGLLWSVTRKLGRGQALMYAAAAGTLLALMQIFFHIGPIVAQGDSVWAQLRTPYPYVGMMVGNTAFLLTQFAFFHGSGIVVVPVVNSFMIIMPMVLEIFVFHARLTSLQYGGAGFIVVGVVLLSARGGEAVVMSDRHSAGAPD